VKKTKKAKSAKSPVWNLGLLYKSPTDPQIEKDMRGIEKMCEDFAGTYGSRQVYLTDEKILLNALVEYEKLLAHLECKPYLYFHSLKDIDATNQVATAQLQLLSNRMAQATNKILFFEISLGKLGQKEQAALLKSPALAHFHVFLSRIFDDARHTLSEAEEKILNLKSLPAREMWIEGNNRILNVKNVTWKGKKLPLAEAEQKIHTIVNAKERYALAGLVSKQYEDAASFAEAEINAVYSNKKIDDELRKYTTPYEDTVRSYRNNADVVENLVKIVTDFFPLAHRFFKVKSRLLGLKKLRYPDRKISIGKITKKFSFDDSARIFKDVVRGIDPKYEAIFDSYLRNGQIDVAPRIGKTGGAYCLSTYQNPTFVLLNHMDSLGSFSTLAHEMGHAFHSELSQSQGPIYSAYSTSLAETASTLFETIAIDAVAETLSEKEQIIALHNRINDDIATIFRQIACFNFEKELHQAVRTRGYVTKEEIADLHNKHMKAYLGPAFEFGREDGYFFVTWSHIRRFFYVYSYAYGQLVSKALVRRYRQDTEFWKKIEQYLSAGGKDSPENILKEIGIDVTKPEFWKEGLKEIEESIERLEKMVKGER
jgi:oligoendopeptidase F